ncbi:MAG TPA: LysM peptidoglycan-binding domain-containing protein [Roseiarcus sp.]|nr:LysM peptidoglycan-binding domain-containing protein [Roseiarcus sp.]
MFSQSATIWAGATGAAVVVAGAVTIYWAHPKFIWPGPDAAAVSESASEGAAPVAPTAKEPSVAPAAAPAALPPPAGDKPAFDVVSVEPSGEAVIAGRAAPNAKVELKDSGRTVAEATANAEGQFVMVPAPLPPGEHSLALSTGAGASAQSSNTVNVAVATPQPTSKAAAAASAPPPPSSTALAVPAAPGAAPSAQSAAGLLVQSVEASPGGRLVAKGAAPPNAVVRLYLGGAYIGDAKTGAGGRWSLTIEHGLTPGAYQVRADEINPSDAKVAARAEAPFDYPAAAAAPTPAAAARSAASPADVVVDSIQTHPVAQGNTLWSISQKYYGDGSHYEAIFAANSGQIRNPNLIYPGQVFVVPKPAPKPKP